MIPGVTPCRAWNSRPDSPGELPEEVLTGSAGLPLTVGDQWLQCLSDCGIGSLLEDDPPSDAIQRGGITTEGTAIARLRIAEGEGLVVQIQV
jgi:hypothetical protein